MKRLFFGLIATVMFSVAGNAQRFQANEFSKVGLEHNRMLDIAYNKILNEKILNENKEIVLKTLVEELKNNEKSEKQLTIGIDLLNKSFQSLPKKGLVTELPNLKNFNLNEKVSKYLEKLFTIIELDNSKDFNMNLISLEKEISSDLSLKNEELYILFSATNIARYSNTYWVENSNKWLMLNPKNVSSNTAQRGRKIVRADVLGGVGGAVGALLLI